MIRGKIDVPTRTGGDASGSWNINSATATALQTARTINGVSFNGTANITITANTPNSLTFNNTGAGGASGSLFNGAGALTVSYNTVGAPSTTGANASGTWGINITGNAATATTATNQSGGTVNATSIAGTSVNVAANGAAADPYGASAVTNPANANNYSYFGLSRAGQIGLGVGITGTTGALGLGPNAFVLGGGTSGAAGTVSSPWIAFNGTNFVASGSITANGQFNGSAAGLTGTAGINITGNAETVTNGVYNNGATYGISISGNAATATNSTQLGGIGSNRTMQKRRGSIDSPANIDTAITAPEMGFVYSSGNAPVSGPFMAFGGLGGDIDYSCQMAVDYQTGNNFVFRTRNDDSMVWNGWRTVLHSNNYLNYSPGLTGTNASGTWGINITGNAGSAYGLAVQGAGSAPGANQVLRSDGNGYTFHNYINSNTGNSENPTISQVVVTNGGDNFYRKASIAHLGNSLNANGYQFVTQTGGSPAYYGARAWVNFNGAGTVAIQAAGNVSSITDNGVGDYTVNFATAMPDTKYSVVSTADRTNQSGFWSNPTVYATNSVRLVHAYAISGSTAFNAGDPTVVHVAVYR
ncbi:hypothetical protein [Limnobacter sp.]|uniref:hypothetical protein n=1 Tax=Limnobacter sp. TaxID=2003368 RepID=UPI00311DF051